MLCRGLNSISIRVQRWCLLSSGSLSRGRERRDRKTATSESGDERTNEYQERERTNSLAYEESGVKEGMEKRNQVSIGLRLRRIPPCLPCVRAFFPSFLYLQRRSVQATENHNHWQKGLGGTIACSGSYRDKTSFRTPFSRATPRHYEEDPSFFEGSRVLGWDAPRVGSREGLGSRWGGATATSCQLPAFHIAENWFIRTNTSRSFLAMGKRVPFPCRRT